MTRRSAIVAEFLNRLRVAHPTAQIERGWAGATPAKFPAIYVFEDTETVHKEKRGVYRKTLSLVTSVVAKASDKKSSYERGNNILQDFVTGVELDERFSELVISYGLAEVEMSLMEEGLIEVAITYKFDYVEEFLGIKKTTR